MAARALTNEELASRIEAHPVTISKLRSGRIDMDDEWRARIAAGLRMNEEALFGEAPLPAPKVSEIFRPLKRRGRKSAIVNRDLPVYGLAAGSMEGAHQMTPEIVEAIPCPPGLAHVAGAYALRAKGDSMVPRYFPGDILYVNPLQEVHAGDHVVIQVLHHENSGTDTWVKRFDGRHGGEVLVSQYNPAAQLTFKGRSVRYLHRILPTNELFPPAD